MAHATPPDDRRARRCPAGGKTVLVTGGARRVGAAIVRLLHAPAPRGDPLPQLRGRGAALARNSTRSAHLGGDRAMRSARQLRLAHWCTRPPTAFGGLDILVNNASSFYPTPLGDIDEDDWNDLIGTNLKAPLFLAQAAAASLRSAAASSSISPTFTACVPCAAIRCTASRKPASSC